MKLQKLFGGLAVVTLSVFPATIASASNWEVMGVSRRTGETIALDRNSIRARSQYDVRFRYLIGKDVVNASVNCTSSQVKPDKGAAFVPDLTGATREMINHVCRHGGSAGSDELRNFGDRPIALKCSFESRNGRIDDTCMYTSFGRLERFTPKSVTLLWSDNARTRIEFLTFERQGGGAVTGVGTVDGEAAEYLRFSNGGICLKVLKNDNSICFK